jgi:hypothetical protein
MRQTIKTLIPGRFDIGSSALQGMNAAECENN